MKSFIFFTGRVLELLLGLICIFMGGYQIIYRVAINYPKEYSTKNLIFYCVLGTIITIIGIIILIKTFRKNKKPGISA